MQENNVSSEVRREKNGDKIILNDDDGVVEKENHIVTLIKKHRRIIFMVMFFIVVAITFTGIGIAEIMGSSSSLTNSEVLGESRITYSPSQAPSYQHEIALNEVLSQGLVDDLAFHFGTNQWKSRMWMIYKDPITLDLLIENKLDRIIQRFILITIYFSFGGETTKGIDWLNRNECESRLIGCDENSKVRSLLLGEFNIDV